MFPGVPAVRVDEVLPDAVLLDVREPEEWRAGHIEGALHVPMMTLPARLADGSQQLPAQSRIVVVCKVGARSAQVTGWLNDSGYDAVNLTGGIVAWAAAGRPLLSADGRAPRIV